MTEPYDPSGFCNECGDELWSAAESCGMCVICQRREQDAEREDYDDE